MQNTDAVESLMHRPVQSLAPDVQAVDALHYAERHGIHHFPLVEGGKITGLVCTCDLEELDLKSPIRRAMHRRPVTIRRTATLKEAVQVMAAEEIGSLLVTDDHEQKVIGIVTREDLDHAGIAVDDAPGFRCSSCGAITHLKREGDKGVLCLDCRLRAHPEEPGDGTGVVD